MRRLIPWLPIILILFIIGYYNHKIYNLKEESKIREEKIRKEAITKSKDVIRGQVSEEFAPILKDFPYTLSDCKFLGSPIDFIVFNGMSTFRDTGEGEIEIVLSDVKSNKARKTQVQNKIKKAVEEGRVKFEQWRVDEDKNLTIK